MTHLAVPRLHFPDRANGWLSRFVDSHRDTRLGPRNRFFYAERLNSVDEAPEPLRGALLRALTPNDTVRLLISNPVQIHPDQICPSTLLAILDRAWIVAAGGEDGQPKVHRCDFGDTLTLQVTSILLYGALRIDFLEHGQKRSFTIYFNAVREALYREAAMTLLEEIAGGGWDTRLRGDDNNEHALRALPLKFQNAVERHVPDEQNIVGFVHWPTAFTRRLRFFLRELAPAAIIVLTNRHLVLIAEEKALWARRPRANGKYGCVVTYYPLSRLERVQLRQDCAFGTIDLHIRAHGAGEVSSIVFPSERHAAVSALMELTMRSIALERDHDAGVSDAREPQR